MSHITPADANAWADKSKLDLTTVDSDLEASVAAQVMARVSAAYDVSGWIDTTTTPSLIRKIIAMMYVSWYYQRTYSEDSNISNYGLLLQGRADILLDGITNGTVILPEVVIPPGAVALGAPEFYPTDNSSALDPRDYPDDQSVGPAKFSMGTVW